MLTKNHLDDIKVNYKKIDVTKNQDALYHLKNELKVGSLPVLEDSNSGNFTAGFYGFEEIDDFLRKNNIETNQ